MGARACAHLLSFGMREIGLGRCCQATSKADPLKEKKQSSSKSKTA